MNFAFQNLGFEKYRVRIFQKFHDHARATVGIHGYHIVPDFPTCEISPRVIFSHCEKMVQFARLFWKNVESRKTKSTPTGHRFCDIDRTGTRLPPNDAAHRAESIGGGPVLQKSKSRFFGAITGGAAPRRRRRRGAKAGPAGPKKFSGGHFP